MNNKYKHSRLIMIALATALLGACAGFDPNAYVPGLYTPTPSAPASLPTASADESAHSETSVVDLATQDAITVAAVCTNIPGGKLNVRFAPGGNSDIRGYLAEGETVTTSVERADVDGSQWIKLTHPIEGWVNETYLCEVEP